MRRPSFLLLFLLGVWAGCTLFMWQVAIQSFAVAERVASSADAGLRGVVGGLPEGDLRLALRYQASEVNRLFFAGWGWVQIPLAAVALFLSWYSRCGRPLTVVVGAMLLIVVLLGTYFVPETVLLGRLIDFAPQTDLPDVRARFWALHHTYTGLDMLKFLLGLGAVGLLCRSTFRGSATT